MGRPLQIMTTIRRFYQKYVIDFWREKTGYRIKNNGNKRKRFEELDSQGLEMVVWMAAPFRKLIHVCFFRLLRILG